MSPSMFEEFYFEGTKAIYDCYRENGVKLIVHHSDSYAATLVPDMIKMGIDIWQGAMTSNNIPELIEKYGKDITFMGGIDAVSYTHLDVYKRQDQDSHTEYPISDLYQRQRPI